MAPNPLIEIRLTKVFIIMATFDNPYGHLLHASARKTSRVSGAVSRFKMYPVHVQEQRSIKYVCKCKQEVFSGVASMRVRTPPPPPSTPPLTSYLMDIAMKHNETMRQHMGGGPANEMQFSSCETGHCCTFACQDTQNLEKSPPNQCLN